MTGGEGRLADEALTRAVKDISNRAIGQAVNIKQWRHLCVAFGMRFTPEWPFPTRAAGSVYVDGISLQASARGPIGVKVKHISRAKPPRIDIEQDGGLELVLKAGSAQHRYRLD